MGWNITAFETDCDAYLLEAKYNYSVLLQNYSTVSCFSLNFDHTSDKNYN
jgi:hypothetical protein